MSSSAYEPFYLDWRGETFATVPAIIWAPAALLALAAGHPEQLPRLALGEAEHARFLRRWPAPEVHAAFAAELAAEVERSFRTVSAPNRSARRKARRR